MLFPAGDKEQPAPGRRRFVIVAVSNPDAVVDHFEATDWGPAIIDYTERVRRGIYGQPVSLREARPGEPAPGGG